MEKKINRRCPYLKYIYGPVASWRLGRSLGIDLFSSKTKVCSFDCVYCQLGQAKSLTVKRKVYVPTEKIIAELKRLPRVKFDYLTFSGRGEPTLAKNLGDCIKKVKRLRPEPVAVLTNATLLNRKDVRNELGLADFVLAKLDVNSQTLLKIVNSSAKGITFSKILAGIKKFKKSYQGKFALQIMLIQENQDIARELARLAREISPDQIQLCTPIRACGVQPLSRSKLTKIKKLFPGIKTIMPYQPKRKRTKPINLKDTMFRRPTK